MALHMRMAQVGLRKQIPCISFHSIEEIAKRVVSTFVISRRSSLSYKRIGRLIAAIAFRRIQETNNTQYAVEFDRIVSALNGIVPSIVNELVRGIPLNGTTNIEGETIRVYAYQKDIDEIVFYVSSPLFAEDLNALKAFSQAHSIAMVQINPFLAYIKGSITLRIKQAKFKGITLPKSIRTSIDYQTTPVTGREIAKLSDPADIEKLANTGEEQEYPVKEAVPKNGQVAVVTHTEDDLTYDDFIYKVSGNDDTMITQAKSLGALFPLTLSQSDVTIPDWLDLLTNTKTVVQYEDKQDLVTMLSAALTYAIQNLASGIQKPLDSPAIAGTLDSRAGSKNVVASEGSIVPKQPPLFRGEKTQNQDYSQVPVTNPSRQETSNLPNTGNRQGRQGGKRNVRTSALLDEKRYKVNGSTFTGLEIKTKLLNYTKGF